MNELMRSVEIKLKRASFQVQSLASSVSDWVARNPITAECKLRDERLGYRLILNDFNEPIPLDEWGLAFGECVHNLRSALDNLAFALARLRTDPPEKPNLIAFPIFQDKHEFEKNGRRSINQLQDAAAALIEKLQPFQRDGSSVLGTPDRDALVLLQWFSNADKHRAPSIALLAPTNIGFEGGVEFLSDVDASANVPPDATVWAGPLSPGIVLIEYRTKHPVASVNGKVECKAIVAIKGIHELAPMVDTLHALNQYTALVVSQFQPFFQQS